VFQPNQRVKVNRSGLPAAAVSEPLNRSTFPRTPEEVLVPTVETVELEQESLTANVRPVFGYENQSSTTVTAGLRFSF
jgi:hypothetical protein